MITKSLPYYTEYQDSAVDWFGELACTLALTNAKDGSGVPVHLQKDNKKKSAMWQPLRRCG